MSIFWTFVHTFFIHPLNVVHHAIFHTLHLCSETIHPDAILAAPLLSSLLVSAVIYSPFLVYTLYYRKPIVIKFRWIRACWRAVVAVALAPFRVFVRCLRVCCPKKKQTTADKQTTPNASTNSNLNAKSTTTNRRWTCACCRSSKREFRIRQANEQYFHRLVIESPTATRAQLCDLILNRLDKANTQFGVSRIVAEKEQLIVADDADVCSLRNMCELCITIQPIARNPDLNVNTDATVANTMKQPQPSTFAPSDSDHERVLDIASLSVEFTDRKRSSTSIASGVETKMSGTVNTGTTSALRSHED